MELNRAKGTRDFLPEDKIVRNNVADLIRCSFEKYGFNPLETPILERFDVLSSKYAGGSEIMKETFKLNDQGKRDLGLRYDLTVPFARIIAMNKGLRMPFKRYAIGKVFRDGPLKLGRYREFWQCDADVVGCKDYVAEVELMNITKDVFENIGVEVNIDVNDRRVLDALVESVGIDKKNLNKVILVLDKLDKVGVEAVKKELIDAIGVSVEDSGKLLEIVLFEGDNSEKFEFVEEIIGENEGLENLRKLFSEVDGLNFSLDLARGLTYYTGTIYEFFLEDGKDYGITSSLGSGGRYDKMIGDFIGDSNEYPAVGISFGLDVLSDVLKIKAEKENEVRSNTVVDVYVISIGCFDEAREIVEKFRGGGIKTDIDLLQRGIGKNLNYASKAGINYVVFVGKKELAEKKVKLKNMVTGEEKLMTVNECFKFLNEELIH